MENAVNTSQEGVVPHITSPKKIKIQNLKYGFYWMSTALPLLKHFKEKFVKEGMSGESELFLFFLSNSGCDPKENFHLLMYWLSVYRL